MSEELKEAIDQLAQARLALYDIEKRIRQNRPELALSVVNRSRGEITSFLKAGGHAPWLFTDEQDVSESTP